LEEMKMKRIETPLVKWLANLARREVLDNYKPTNEEITSIQTIAQFYHQLVPLMWTVLKPQFDERLPVSVFVPHTGADKEAYADCLASFLKKDGIEDVFIDKNMRVGGEEDDEMMWAAVSCKYFWYREAVAICKIF
jgi:hypothetical protein